MEVVSPELTRPSFPDNYHPSYPPAASSGYNPGEELRTLNIWENENIWESSLPYETGHHASAPVASGGRSGFPSSSFLRCRGTARCGTSRYSSISSGVCGSPLISRLSPSCGWSSSPSSSSWATLPSSFSSSYSWSGSPSGLGSSTHRWSRLPLNLGSSSSSGCVGCGK